VVLWGISTIVFVVMRLSGDPIVLILPPDAPTAEVFRVRREMGLDQPLWVQYLIFLQNAMRGDFGQSIHFRQPALAVALERIPATIQLAVTAFALAVVVAVPVGILAAVRRYSLYDHLGMLLALLGQSVPTFFLGILLLLIFAVWFPLLPIGGTGTPAHLVMPAVTLGAFAMASIARLTRSAIIEVLSQDYVRTARAKGLGEATVVLRHGFRNALIPVVTIMGLQFGTLLGGAVVTETIFAWPGIGRLAIQSIFNRDYPVVQATVFLAAVAFVGVNLAVDILYAVLDPRIRYE